MVRPADQFDRDVVLELQVADHLDPGHRPSGDGLHLRFVVPVALVDRHRGRRASSRPPSRAGPTRGPVARRVRRRRRRSIRTGSQPARGGRRDSTEAGTASSGGAERIRQIPLAEPFKEVSPSGRAAALALAPDAVPGLTRRAHESPTALPGRCVDDSHALAVPNHAEGVAVGVRLGRDVDVLARRSAAPLQDGPVGRFELASVPLGVPPGLPRRSRSPRRPPRRQDRCGRGPGRHRPSRPTARSGTRYTSSRGTFASPWTTNIP